MFSLHALTLGLFAEVAHELARTILHDPLLVVWTQWITLHTQRLQLIQETKLMRQILKLVLVQQ